MIKVAVAGYGYLGKFHCQKVDQLEICELSYIIEPFASNANQAKANHSNSIVVSQIEDCLEYVDALVIVTPTATHAELLKKALSANKHVFCEKPLAKSLDEIKDVQVPKDLVVQMGHSERFHELWSFVQDLLSTDQVLYARFSRVSPFKGRATDVGVIEDLMFHDIDLCLFLFKEKKFKCELIHTSHLSNQDDYALARLHFTSGPTCDLEAARSHVCERRSIELVTLNKTISIDLQNESVTYYLKNPSEPILTKAFNKRDHLLLEHQSFYESILNKSDVAVSYQDGLQVLTMMDQILKSKKSIK